MPLEYFEPDIDTASVVAALKRDGAAIVRNQVSAATANAILAELREQFDTQGRND